jgi:hypothetical protein
MTLILGTWSYLRIYRRSVLPYTRFCNFLLDYGYVLHIVNFAILYSKLLVKGQSQYAHNGLNIVQAIIFHWKHGLEYFTELLHWTQGSVTTLIQGHSSKVEVTIHSGFWQCPSHNFSLSLWIGIFHRTVTLEPRKCQEFDPRSRSLYT